MSKEYKIGDTIEYDGTRLKVVEDLSMSCEKCYFYCIGRCKSRTKEISKQIGVCEAYERSDKNYIIYVKEE